MYGYIYLTTNNINGKRYVGQKKSDIFLAEKYLGSGTYLKRAINKYGKENFTTILLEECSNEEELNEREIYWIAFYDACNSKDFYNQTYDGEVKGKKMSIESRKKCSDAHKGKTLSKEHKDKISKSMVGKNKSVETKHKMSKAQSGSNNPNYKHKWINKDGNNIIVSNDELDNYLSDGWKLGMCKEEIAHNIGKICINNGKVNKYVYEKDFSYYLSLGWEKGRWNKTNYK